MPPGAEACGRAEAGLGVGAGAWGAGCGAELVSQLGGSGPPGRPGSKTKMMQTLAGQDPEGGAETRTDAAVEGLY